MPIISRKISSKVNQYLCHPEEGLSLSPVSQEEQNHPSIRTNRREDWLSLASGLKKHFGSPQDVEWAISGDDQIWILQTRPLMAIGEDSSISENHTSFG